MTGKAAALDELYRRYAKQPVLREVADGKRLVRGAGPFDAPLVVVGEAPGETEDRLGEPFTGKSGQLLQELFARAGLPWDLCYRTNVLPWRPPGNRVPHNFEIVASYGRLAGEIEIIGPAIVVAAGATAWQALSWNEHGGFTGNIGRWLEPEGESYRLTAIYHPAFILRHGEGERAILEADTVAILHSALAASGG